MSDDMLADLKEMGLRIGEAPEPLAYLVLDHAMSPTEVQTGRDGRGKRYARCSPSAMDAVPHARKQPSLDPNQIVPLSLTGVPVYKREDLPDDWPDA